MVIETCPKCGHDLLESVINTFPPIPRKECFHCGWSWEGKPENVIRVPFGASDSESIATLLDKFEYHPEKKNEILEKYSSLMNG